MLNVFLCSSFSKFIPVTFFTGNLHTNGFSSLLRKRDVYTLYLFCEVRIPAIRCLRQDPTSQDQVLTLVFLWVGNIAKMKSDNSPTTIFKRCRICYQIYTPMHSQSPQSTANLIGKDRSYLPRMQAEFPIPNFLPSFFHFNSLFGIL